jgi:hypothetical protein
MPKSGDYGLLGPGKRVSVILGRHMKPVRDPRPLFLLILILVAAAFLTGILRAFHDAGAAVSIPAKASVNDLSMAATDPTSIPAQKQTGTDLSPQPTPVVGLVSADTTGIIALAIVIVLTILVGATWGVRSLPKRKKPRR